MEKYTGKVDVSRGYYMENRFGYNRLIDNTNSYDLTKGFNAFYQKTGVFPFLYIMDDVPYEYANNMQWYVDIMYKNLFNAGGNLLFVYIASKNIYWVTRGELIKDIINNNALNIINGNINFRYNDNNIARRFGDALEAVTNMDFQNPAISNNGINQNYICQNYYSSGGGVKRADPLSMLFVSLVIIGITLVTLYETDKITGIERFVNWLSIVMTAGLTISEFIYKCKETKDIKGGIKGSIKTYVILWIVSLIFNVIVALIVKYLGEIVILVIILAALLYAPEVVLIIIVP